MSNRRVDVHRLEELVRLHRMGTGAREVARLLKMGPNIERRYRTALASEGLLAGSVDDLPALDVLKAAVEKHAPPPATPPQAISSLDAHRDTIAGLVKKGLRPRAIFDRLRLDLAPFRGSYSAVKRLCRALRKAEGVRAEDVAIPVETAPGEIAQVDFGYVGKLLDPETMTLRKAWCFVMVLGYSRHMVVRVVFDQKTETWLRLHVEAFSELGGVVETVVPDNLKAAVVRAAFSVDGTTELNRSYRELAHHYGFKIDPTPPYDAAKKGKVEAGVKYVKSNFFTGREKTDAAEVRRDLARWTLEIAGTRTHGTTFRKPLEVFTDIEKPALRPLPRAPFEAVVWKKASVHRDTHVAFDRRLYSVPWRLIGSEVWVQATARSVAIYADDVRVATHARRGPGPRSTIESHLPDHRADLRHRSREHWEQRADAMGAEVGLFIREVFDVDDVLSQLRTVQAIVTHLESFPRERARAACVRARLFGAYGYPAIKNILRRALDLEPLPAVALPAAPTSNDVPRFAFARPAATWSQSPPGGTRESPR
jgi:transposase